MLNVRYVGQPWPGNSSGRPDEGADDVEGPAPGRAYRNLAFHEAVEIEFLVAASSAHEPGDSTDGGGGKAPAPAATTDKRRDGELVARLQVGLEAQRDELEQLPAPLPGQEIARRQSDPDNGSPRKISFSLRLEHRIAHP